MFALLNGREHQQRPVFDSLVKPLSAGNAAGR